MVMLGPAISTEISVNVRGVVYTGGSMMNAVITVVVHRSEIALGAAKLTLMCEERAPTAPISTIVEQYDAPNVPERLSRGSHAFPIELKIPESVEHYPSLLIAHDAKRSVGVYWLIKLSFDKAEWLASSEVLPIYPPRSISRNVWSLQEGCSESDIENPINENNTNNHYNNNNNNNTADDDNNNNNNNNNYNTAPERNDNNGRPRSSTEARHWRLQRRPRRTESRYRVIVSQFPFIVSKHGTSKPAKSKCKIFMALFGETSSPPEKAGLGEVKVRAELYVPRCGVFQSPHKAGIHLCVMTGRKDAVLLSAIKVKLTARTQIKETNAVIENPMRIYESEPNIILPEGEADISDELANLEIPTTCESTETNHLLLRYVVRVTLVFRALHQSNMSRWLTIESPVSVLPSIIKSPTDQLATAPPPYEG